MNRNYPKVKNSLKWSPQPAKPSINNQTNFIKKPNYSSRAGKMVKVLYGRDYSHYCLTINNNVTLLCTYFVTNKRYIFLIGITKLFSENVRWVLRYLIIQVKQELDSRCYIIDNTRIRSKVIFYLNDVTISLCWQLLTS